MDLIEWWASNTTCRLRSGGVPEEFEQHLLRRLERKDIDRVLSAQPETGAFAVPISFDHTDHLTDGRIYHSNEDVEVVVRYSPRIARWFIERDEGQATDDGRWW